MPTLRELPEGLLVAQNRQSLAAGAAEWIKFELEEVLDLQPICRLLLAGGQTPRALYALLALEPEIEWSRCELWWGDERCVPPDHADSNFRMVNETLLQPLAARGQVPARVERWRTELGPEEAAAHYDRELRTIALVHETAPQFDIAILGMGADGHTASLFPQTPALDERERLAVVNTLRGGQGTRLTVTWPIIEAAQNVVVLVAGADKHSTLAAALHGPINVLKMPIQMLLDDAFDSDAEVTWFLDEDAAQSLSDLTQLNRL